MFSEVQRNWIQQYLLTVKKDYPYYIAYTNSNVNQYGQGDDYNFYLLLSSEPIEASSRYSYRIPDNSVLLGVRSGSASYNFHASRIAELSASSTVNINNYEFVYTNAEFSSVSLQPDILATQLATQSHFDGFSIILLITIASVCMFKLLRMGGRYEALYK